MYREYTTIVQTRLACQILESGTIEKVSPTVSLYKNKVGAITQLEEFIHVSDAVIEAGDYIVKTPDGNTVHAKKDEFEGKYKSSGFILR